MRPLAPGTQEEIVARLLHDLSQPLSAIGLSAFYLNILLGEPGGKVGEQIGAISTQADHASRLIGEAAAELRLMCAQPSAAGSLEPTNSDTACVT